MTGVQTCALPIYFFNNSGAAQTGWLYRGTEGGKAVWYYMDENGTMQTGWQEVNGKWYFLNDSGRMQTGWLYRGNENDKDIWYYMGTDGAMTTGWQKINGSWYYMNESGRMQTGWLILGEKKYYLDDSGKMVTGWKKIIDEWNYPEWYFFKDSGEIYTGWLYRGVDSEGEEIWYYLMGSSSVPGYYEHSGYISRSIESSYYGEIRILRWCNDDGTGYLFDRTSGRLQYSFKWSDDDTECYFYSPSGKYVKTLNEVEAWKLTRFIGPTGSLYVTGTPY